MSLPPPAEDVTISSAWTRPIRCASSAGMQSRSSTWGIAAMRTFPTWDPRRRAEERSAFSTLGSARTDSATSIGADGGIHLQSDDVGFDRDELIVHARILPCPDLGSGQR